MEPIISKIIIWFVAGLIIYAGTMPLRDLPYFSWKEDFWMQLFSLIVGLLILALGVFLLFFGFFGVAL